jgi:hypothetical protein
MSVYELDTSWAATADERRHLHWELLASEQVQGVFLTAREDELAVLFAGDRIAFDAWARTLEPGGTHDFHPATTTSNREGAI